MDSSPTKPSSKLISTSYPTDTKPILTPASLSRPPEDEEVERRLNDILKSMDLPPDKAKILRAYDSKKKWELICDQERVTAKDAPAVYLTKLRQLIHPKLLSSKARSLTINTKRKSKNDAAVSSTQTLRNLETSLRTNNIEWVREFLNQENSGLDVLVDYLAWRLLQIRDDNALVGGAIGVNGQSNSSNGNGHSTGLDPEPAHKSLRLSRSSVAKRLGQPQDDVHVCILCLRAIMNNKFGFNMVISRADAISYIALSLVHKSLRTKALVLELLAAICLVKGGHEMILSAFNHFQSVHHEAHRFDTLMYYFRNYDEFNVDFMVACMQFINIIVHSVDDMNYRVYLQYEFTIIGLDDYLEKLKHHESEELTTQISAYLDNVFDVTALMKDAEISHAALERVQEVEDELSHANERVKMTENAALGRISSLENRLTDLARERDELRLLHEQTDHELCTLKRSMSQKEEEARRVLLVKMGELEQRIRADAGSSGINIPGGDGSSSTESGLHFTPVPISGPPPPPPPPPPPQIPGQLSTRNVEHGKPFNLPGTSMFSAPPPPPAPGMAEAPLGAFTIKRKINTKHKLPVLNWIVLKPNQVKGTIFNELDDEKILTSLDFSTFEEQFKTSQTARAAALSNGDLLSPDHVDSSSKLVDSPSKPRFKRIEKVSLLEPNRLRNLAIMRRNIELSTDEVVFALNNFDMQMLSQDYIEVLLRIMPNEEEIKKYREYEREKRSADVLTDEDRFLFQLTGCVERLGQKLQIMNFINTFPASVAVLTPQLQAIFAASRAVKKSDKFRRILELILAFGNYLNSSRRGPAYGFKLQSLESLLDLKSTDKKITLLHYIVQTVQDSFSQILHFDNELIFVDKAADVSLENVVTDIHELDKGMETTRRECELKKPCNALLRDFLQINEPRLAQLQKEQHIAIEAFSDVAEFFGESKRTIQPRDFFTSILRFTKAFKAAEEENNFKRMKLLEMSSADHSAHNLLRGRATKKSQDSMLNELKNKAGNVKEKKLIPQEEVYHGALEDILLGLKNEPYRRADALRRSQRRKDGVALSQAMSELDL